MGYVKLTGTTNRHTDWTSEIILERDEETGEVTKSVKSGVPVELTADEKKSLEEQGYVFEDSSAAEAKQLEEQRATQPQVGADVASAAPLLGDAEVPNQGEPDSGESDQGGGSRRGNRNS